jgi:GntR family transcriptional regulator
MESLYNCIYNYTIPNVHTMNKILDKHSPIPLYHQLANWLEARIADGTYQVGESIPSETQISEDFHLNRNTVRHALASLSQKGLIERRRGEGTFVKRRALLIPVHRLDRITSFVDDFEINGIELDDRELSKEVVDASEEIARKLQLDPGARVIRVERLRIADQTPLVLERQYYSYENFQGLLEEKIQGSMYQILLQQFNADLHHSIQTLRAVMPSDEIVQRLNIGKIIPCMFLESITYDSRDKPVELLYSFYRGDRYLFQVESSQYRR